MKKIFFLILLISSIANAQVEKKTVYVKYIQQEITIDGKLDEDVWSKAKPATNFYEYFPTDTAQAKQQAEIRFLFDDKNLYVGIKVNGAGRDYVVPSLRRDFRAGGNDNITLLFDTFNDGTNAFVFGSNPMGVQREVLISGGGNDVSGFNTAWDAKWFSESTLHDDHYILEWAIPLYSFKYREGETKWRFNSYHFDTQTNERNTWIRIPQNQTIFSLAYMGDMVFEKPLGKSKSPIWVAPFVNGFSGKDFETNEGTNTFTFGGDARLTVGNSMNLDLTINPDFSQVEVDQQVTNLTRFEIGLPERRQFFIENSDLFGDFGNSRDSNPFFSRRIGIARNKNDETIENKIIAGARLSGKINNNLRLGFLNMQTQEDLDNEIPSVNNTVISLQQKMFSRSNLNFLFINKQATKDYSFLAPEDRYNRVVGIDYRLASADNTWSGRYFFHQSFSPGVSSKDYSAGFNTQYNDRTFGVRLSGVFVGDNYRSDLGFIRRTDIFKINPQFELKFWPKKGAIQRHSFQLTPIYLWRPNLNFELSDYTVISRWSANFRNTAELRVSMFNRFTKLYDPFDPTRTDGGLELPGNADYYYTNLEVDFRSDRRKVISYQLTPSIGQFYNGNRYSMRVSMNWRTQPYLSGSIQMQYDRIELPDPYPSASILLVGPRFDVTFSKSIFWATFIQYSNQRQNFSVNTRLQWRFAPLSDLFVVYNDNYNTALFTPRFRSINLKLTYWINI
ncbi:MAG: hydrolase [Flavobacteriaceae bacterium]|nr:hydrolase [Flavobacteriaceae bacterium]|tara:strand:+ start:33540 stop:35732 length:2193 start_codon:yes stop_codon:yes gene_type:complete